MLHGDYWLFRAAFADFGRLISSQHAFELFIHILDTLLAVRPQLPHFIGIFHIKTHAAVFLVTWLSLVFYQKFGAIHGLAIPEKWQKFLFTWANTLLFFFLDL